METKFQIGLFAFAFRIMNPLATVIIKKGSMFMSIGKTELGYLNRISKELKNGYLSIFAGAGLSVSSGYVDWRNLLNSVLDELQIRQGVDLATLAQYHENAYGRQRLNTLIVDEFSKIAKPNNNVDLLSLMPISTFWTTNYDSVIEDSLRKNGKTVDVKYEQTQFKYHQDKCDVVVYKMHGHKDCPDDVVLTKSDYETYDLKRGIFTQVLQYELIVKTFLFIGFSFSDSNLDRIIGTVKHSFNTYSSKDHYCFMKSVSIEECGGDHEKFENDKSIQAHKIKDMRRYGIHTILVENYQQITKMLEYIKKTLEMDYVFISGAVKKDDQGINKYGLFGKEKSRAFLSVLTKALIDNNYRIITGFGNEIGDSIVAAAFDEIYNSKVKDINEKISIHPMIPRGDNIAEFERKRSVLRRKLIQSSGFFICVYGRAEESEALEGDGTNREFLIAKELDRIIIPIGATGFTARYVYQKLIDERINDKDYLKTLNNLNNNDTSANELVRIVLMEMNRQKQIFEKALVNDLKINNEEG